MKTITNCGEKHPTVSSNTRMVMITVHQQVAQTAALSTRTPSSMSQAPSQLLLGYITSRLGYRECAGHNTPAMLWN
jgi:hypothetical protein